MGEDGVEAALAALREDVSRLRDEGRDRSQKIEQVLLQATKTNGRVNGLEARERSRDEKMSTLEKRIWQVAALLAALGGVGKDLIGIFH